ncbi:MAG: glycoside hydrolase family 15 protein [Actinobacteria bacterium]|nr:glycoside hydrolase family 15 protein [Actinomycetota bacterium]
MALPIEDYGIIGDTHTVALVGRNGSIDWLCLPRFDSEACFAALLGDDSNGCWKIAPVGGGMATRRHYMGNTLVLVSEFDTIQGTARVIDTMPIREEHPWVIRVVEGVSGKVDMRMDLTIRFGYGSTIPWVHRSDGLLVAVAGPDTLALWTPVETRGIDRSTVAEFSISQGQRVPFTLSWSQSHQNPPRPIDAWYSIEDTRTCWEEWVSHCTFDGEWGEAVVRSLITLKALTYEPTGGIVAAATAALPETLGGMRNWDYRYCWLRDATLTLGALMRSGYHEEALAWRDWLLRAVAGDPSELQIMYGPAGERRLAEWDADWLPGYEGSRPVRIGNAASEQYQLDVYGEVLSTLCEAARVGDVPTPATWGLASTLMEFLESNWSRPDDGIWEVRGPQRHFTHSKVMAWAGVDKIIKMAEAFPPDAVTAPARNTGTRGMSRAIGKGDSRNGPGPLPIDRWRQLRSKIHKEVLVAGYNPKVGAFTQFYGSDALDASVLMIPMVGFLPATDERMISTIEAIERDLTEDGYVLRYRAEDAHDVDGLSGREGAFLACSFWMADCLALIGRESDARALFEKLLGLRNDLGLLSEEYDMVAKRLVGNFPQAFSHVSLVNAAYNLSGHSMDTSRSIPPSQLLRKVRQGSRRKKSSLHRRHSIS